MDGMMLGVSKSSQFVSSVGSWLLMDDEIRSIIDYCVSFVRKKGGGRKDSEGMRANHSIFVWLGLPHLLKA
eukprot:scaffold4009_cov208-Chaetoceros_neogracile.AAC.2